MKKVIKKGLIIYMLFVSIFLNFAIEPPVLARENQDFYLHENQVVSSEYHINKDVQTRFNHHLKTVIEIVQTRSHPINNQIQKYIEQVYNLFVSYNEKIPILIKDSNPSYLTIRAKIHRISEDVVSLEYTHQIYVSKHILDYHKDNFVLFLNNDAMFRSEYLFDKSKISDEFYEKTKEKISFINNSTKIDDSMVDEFINDAHIIFREEAVIFYSIKNIHQEVKIPYYYSVSAINPALSHQVVIHNPHSKKIAITFDDGPTRHTRLVLDLLDKYNAKATFFLLGLQVEKYPDVVLEIANRGHEIGNHSYNHKRFTAISTSDVLFQINHTNQLIAEIIGRSPNLLRPPYGIADNRIKSLTNMQFVNWNIDSLDWKTRNTRKIIHQVISTTKNNGIILMHDLYPATIDALEPLLINLQDQGYEFVSVSKLTDY